MAHEKYLSLEEARRMGRIDQFCKEQPSKGDWGQFDAALAVGVAAVFMETHRDPDHAPSDGPNMVPFQALPGLVETLMEFDKLAKANPIAI